MRMSLLVSFCALFMNSCYMQVDSNDDSRAEDTQRSSDTTPVSTTPASMNLGKKLVDVSGYVVSAFEVQVDGTDYLDLEDFYTKELDRLPNRMKEAGYDESYTFELEAQIGFEDLWRDMTVYILSAGKAGYQAKTFVNDQGGFKTFLPVSEEDRSYKIRANKRISIRATKAGETKLFCYNFSAKEKDATFTSLANPTILDSFTTTITAYECMNDDASGLVVPERP